MRADQVALERGKSAEHGQHQASVRGRRFGPCVMQRTKTRAVAGDRRQRVQEVAGRARQPDKPCHRQHVAFGKLAGTRHN